MKNFIKRITKFIVIKEGVNMQKNIYETLKEYALSNEEVIKLMNSNIISKEINNVIFKEKDGGYVCYVEDKFPQIRSDAYFYQWCPYLSTLGIKMVFVEGDDSGKVNHGISIFITDFHLIVSKGARISNNPMYMYEKPDDLLIIPLEKIKNIELSSLGTKSTYIPGYSYTKQKSPIKGAIVGGIVAGPTGAVVGAIANQGEKKVTNYGYSINKEEYELIIDIDENNTISLLTVSMKVNTNMSNVLEANKKLSKINSNEPIYSEDPIKMINEKLNFLMNRAKNKGYDEEKSFIVQQTLEEGLKKFQKHENYMKMETPIFWGILFGVAILLGVIFS